MKPEKQRIAIAEACGWTGIIRRNPCDFGGLRGVDPNGCTRIVPSYIRDLNAMNEAELTLDEAQHDAFQQHLLKIIAPKTHWSDMANTRIVSASAPQRAESFLRTIGKWEVSE